VHPDEPSTLLNGAGQADVGWTSPAATPLPQPSSPTCSVSTRCPPVIASSATGPHRRGDQLITPLVFGGVAASLGTTVGQSAAASAGVVARHRGCPGPRTAVRAGRAGPGCPVSHWALRAGNILCLRPRPRGACAPDAPGRAAAYQHDLLLGCVLPGTKGHGRIFASAEPTRGPHPRPRLRADPTAAYGEVRGHACRPVARPPPMAAGLVAGWKSPPRGGVSVPPPDALPPDTATSAPGGRPGAACPPAPHRPPSPRHSAGKPAPRRCRAAGKRCVCWRSPCSPAAAPPAVRRQRGQQLGRRPLGAVRPHCGDQLVGRVEHRPGTAGHATRR
jgi:hypothetical protein